MWHSVARPAVVALAAFASTLIAPVAGALDAVPPLHYSLAVALEPPRHRVSVDVQIELPPSFAGETVEFLLNPAFRIESSTPEAKKTRGTRDDIFQGINGSSVDLESQDDIAHYRVRLARDSTTIRLRYSGEIDYPLATQAEEYTRGFRETPGLVDERGVYLAGSTLWYPYFSNELVKFDLTARTPKGWHLISQGNGTSRDSHGVANWSSGGKVDEIYLVGGPLTRTVSGSGRVEAQVYLREPDPALTGKYLDATSRYIDMYEGLLGPYPYSKFALVENFWETGYGMPSFTLLGPQIIRFPFILTSSYPHEILHNWWGNSVFVDYKTGNWAEGLTAYLADHLMKEQQGQGAEYRRDTLKKYRDFVREDRDFPLREFRSRHSAATEAVGYGKTMMGLHMLRRQLGDAAFSEALSGFYARKRNTRAGFDDLQTALEQAGGQDLDRFFTEWVTQTGAADLSVEAVTVTQVADGYRVAGRLVQRQSAGPFLLDVPLAAQTDDGVTAVTTRMTAGTAEFDFPVTRKPLALHVDPEFDLFRLLDARETAPSVGQVSGDARVLAVLPASEAAGRIEAYRSIVERWTGPVQDVSVIMDNAIDTLPADRAVWLFGRANRFAAPLFAKDRLAAVSLNGDGLSFPGGQIAASGQSSVLVIRNPDNAAKGIGWIVVDPIEAGDAIARKIPHYGKYSYLGFAGAEAENVLKGEWVASDSPLRVDLRTTDERMVPLQPPAWPPRNALAELPPRYSADRLLEHVRPLANPGMRGRGLGSDELEQAADYIGQQFAAAGLAPGGDDGTFFQSFTVDTGPDGGPHTVRNVIGVVPGNGEPLSGEAVIVSAHYDHLGLGWPDERAQAEPGAVYAGADDNASGVAALLELARSAVQRAANARTLIFIAFTAEEAGLLGSRYYAEHPAPLPLNATLGVINLDTVGRLGDQPVQILATESATEWPFIFRGLAFETGVSVKTVAGATESSDQMSFVERGVPGVQVFTGAHLDYHRPGDTPDKVDADGLVRVATLVDAAIGYLAGRDAKLTPAGRSDAPDTGGSGQRRRVSFGLVPDFGDQGPGVRAESIVPGSPAEQAGLSAGDRVLSIDGNPVADLRDFSNRLKTYEAGQRVTATVRSDDQTSEVEIELIER